MLTGGRPIDAGHDAPAFGEFVDGILTVDDRGRIESFNTAAARMFGYAADELAARPLTLLLPVLASDRFDDRLLPYAGVPDAHRGHRRLDGRRKDGTPLPVEMSVGEMLLGGRRLFTVLLRDLSPRPAARPALGADGDLLDVLMNNLPDSIYFKDATSRFIQINRALANRFGLNDPAEAVGKSDFDFFTAEHAQQAYANEQEMIRGGQPIVALEEKETWSDGRVTWASTTKMPIFDKQGRIVGTFGISRDVTDRREAEQKLERISRFLDSVIENLPIMLFVKDAEHLRFERLNKAGEELLGFSREQLLGKSDYDLFPKDEADFFIAKDRVVLDGRQLVDVPEEVIETRHGTRMLHTRKIPLLDEQGRPTHLVGISEDITLRKEAHEALERSKEAAEAASRSKSEFLANVSHEIRTPMNGIIGMTELALDTELAPEQREFLNMVKASADSLLDVINDILDFSKIEAGKFDLDELAFPLRDSLGDTMKTLALRAHKKGLELACHVPAGVPDGLLGDPGRLRQIVVNLVGNAIKFTEVGEVVVWVELAAHTAHEATLHFAVRDTGIGIPRDKQQAVFAPFVQADGSTTRKYGGTGLGLAIAARLVELMGGRIWVESDEGAGSTFHFTARFALAQGPLAAVAKPTDLDDLRVLVVDDNATNRRILKEMLTNWHMRPTVVSGGEEALVEMQRAVVDGEPYALVLLDAMMPGMDGYTLVRRIQERLEYAGATIMMLSSADRSAARASDLRIAASLLKPIKQSELFDAIMTSLGISLRRGATADEAVPSQVECGSRWKVLLAEDNAVNQKLVVRLLEKRGHEVTIAADGREAVAAAEREPFDVVLMDVQMPELGGFEATAAIRERERVRGGHVPIVAMTAHAMKGDRERCLAAGMDGYIAKPVQARELFDALDQAIAAVPPPATADWPMNPEAPRTDGAASRVAATTADDAPDFDIALGKLEGDHELLQELVALFLDEWPRWRDELDRALAAGDAPRLKRLGHTVKGAMGQLGVDAAFEAAQRVEKLDGELAGALEACAELKAEIERVTPWLAACVNS
jgi:PAS domain S-box-containing protein